MLRQVFVSCFLFSRALEAVHGTSETGCCWMVAEGRALGCPWAGEMEGQTGEQHRGAELVSWAL